MADCHSSSVRVRETIAYAFDALLSKEALDAVGVGASTSSSSSSTHASVSAATPTKSTLNTTTSDDVLANVLHVLLSASSGDRVLALR